MTLNGSFPYTGEWRGDRALETIGHNRTAASMPSVKALYNYNYL